jgi:hypothetical protein
MTEREPEKATEREVEDQAALAPDDPQTSREELELDLMEEGESEAGERISSSEAPGHG